MLYLLKRKVKENLFLNLVLYIPKFDCPIEQDPDAVLPGADKKMHPITDLKGNQRPPYALWMHFGKLLVLIQIRFLPLDDQSYEFHLFKLFHLLNGLLAVNNIGKDIAGFPLDAEVFLLSKY